MKKKKFLIYLNFLLVDKKSILFIIIKNSLINEKKLN
jgi:hypothetical protein